jgi:predicted enzyme related to lactoylglutathione lyase
MAPIAVLDTVTVDTNDPGRLARFYSDILGLPVIDSGGEFAQLAPFSEGGPSLLFLMVPERKAIKNRLHMDFQVQDVPDATRRCEELGAHQVKDGLLAGPFTWQVMLDPEGNEFCLCPAS